ncbi:hypothetical protein Emed_004272 [Eimeria media]
MRLRSIKAASCTLVGLCMHVLSGAPSSLLVDGAVTETAREFIGPRNTTADLLSEGVGTSTVSDEGTLRDVDNTNLRVLLSNSDITEETGAQLEDGAKQGNTEDARKNPRSLAPERKPCDISRSVKRFHVSVFVALCLCILAVRGKGFPIFDFLKKSSILQTGGVDEKLISGVKVLRKLVPVADSLGKAVDTAEARELLKVVHANIPEDGEGDGKAVTIHEENIKNGLSAMRGLQHASVKEMARILRENFDNLSSLSSLLKEWEKGYFSDEGAKELSPFITALRVSQKLFVDASQHMQVIYDLLEQAQSYEDEQFVKSLQTSRDDFKAFLSLQEVREKAATLALEQCKMAEAAIRMALSRKASQGFWQVWGELEIAQAYVDIARKAGGVAAAEGESAAEVQDHLDKAQLRLAKYKEELNRLMDYSRLETHDSISDTLTRSITFEEKQESLRSLLANYWDLFEKQVKMPEKLEDSGRESVRSVLRQALQRISADRDAMNVAVTSRLSEMAKVFDDPVMNNQHALSKQGNHDLLQRRMAAEMLDLLDKAEGRIVQVDSLLQSVDQEEDTKAAAKMMKDAVASAVQSSDELTRLRLSLLRIDLLISAAQAANSTMEKASENYEKLRGLMINSSLEPNRLERLLQSFSEMKDMLTQKHSLARTAVAIEDRIQAAGRMQEMAFSLRQGLCLLETYEFA